MKEYGVRYVDLPCTAKGVTVQDETGFYNIYINSLLSCEEQAKALAHELGHIQREDFDDAGQIERIEPYRRYRPDLVQPSLPLSPPKRRKSPRGAEPPHKEAPSQEGAIVSHGPLFAFTAKMERRKTRDPWRLDTSKLDRGDNDRKEEP